MPRKPILPEAEPRSCRRCGKTFTPERKYWRRVFCSLPCQRAACMRPKELNAELGKQSREKIGAAQRGRGEGRAYRKLLGRHEHRVVAEQKIGRALQTGEVVHHIDGNKLNNHPDNLEVLPSQSAHMSLHRPHLCKKARAGK